MFRLSRWGSPEGHRAERELVEVKAVESLLPIHQAQLLTYMKLAGCQVGLLINFQVPVLKNGIKRLVLGFDERLARS